MNEQLSMSVDRLLGLADAYLVGEIDADALAELELELKRSPVSREHFVGVIDQSAMMREVFGNAAEQLVVTEQLIASDPAHLDDFLSTLSALEAPAGSDLAPIDLTEEIARRDAEKREQSRLARRLAERQRVLSSNGQDQPSAVLGALTWVGVAAMIGLVVWLAWPEASSTPGQRPLPGLSDAAQLDAVARVASVEGARWSGGSACRVGAQLSPGSINLTHGQVTLQFDDGAEVVLHAPARFSIHGGAACELHTGRLQANIPARHHGFEVFVPGGVVAGQETAFEASVAAGPRRPVVVEVTRGEVAVATLRGAVRGAAVRLRQDQFAQVPTEGSRINTFQREARWLEFAQGGTGQHHSHGEVDTSWTVQSPGSDRWRPTYVVVPEEVVDANNNGQSGWLASFSQNARWLSLSARPQTRPEGVYAFRTTFTIPEYVDLETVVLNLRYIADDSVHAIRLGNQQILGAQPQPFPELNHSASEQFQTWSQVSLERGFAHGENELIVELENMSGITGLCIDFTLEGMSLYTPLSTRSRSARTRR